MSDTLQRIKGLAAKGQVRVSEHGYDELADDNLLARDVINGLPAAEIIEDYPDFPKGPCVLVLQRDPQGKPVHAVWGIPKGQESPTVLVTAYLPDPARWTSDFRSRRHDDATQD